MQHVFNYVIFPIFGLSIIFFGITGILNSPFFSSVDYAKYFPSLRMPPKPKKKNNILKKQTKEKIFNVLNKIDHLLYVLITATIEGTEYVIEKIRYRISKIPDNIREFTCPLPNKKT